MKTENRTLSTSFRTALLAWRSGGAGADRMALAAREAAMVLPWRQRRKLLSFCHDLEKGKGPSPDLTRRAMAVERFLTTGDPKRLPDAASSFAFPRAAAALRASASIALAATLLSQGAWMARDRVAAAIPGAEESYRAACRVAGCEPFRFDPEAIVVEDSSVTTVSRREGLLLVEASVRNKSPWTAPVPMLSVEIRDASGSGKSRVTAKPFSGTGTLAPGAGADLYLFVTSKGEPGEYRIRATEAPR